MIGSVRGQKYPLSTFYRGKRWRWTTLARNASQITIIVFGTGFQNHFGTISGRAWVKVSGLICTLRAGVWLYKTKAKQRIGRWVCLWVEVFCQKQKQNCRKSKLYNLGWFWDALCFQYLLSVIRKSSGLNFWKRDK